MFNQIHGILTMSPLPRTLVLVLSACLLTSCGLKGPLTLPENSKKKPEGEQNDPVSAEEIAPSTPPSSYP
jgi:predicted small lipoprotein YifL